MSETFVSQGGKLIHEWSQKEDFIKFREDHAAVMRNLAKYIDKALRTRDEEIERLRLQLAACGVAALSNTEDSAKSNRITRDNPYWSASYGDVCDMVDREMALRAEVKTLKQKELVLYDIHDALGVKWGDDPYAVINKMKSEVLALTEKLVLATSKKELFMAEVKSLTEKLVIAEGKTREAVNMTFQSIANFAESEGLGNFGRKLLEQRDILMDQTIRARGGEK